MRLPLLAPLVISWLALLATAADTTSSDGYLALQIVDGSNFCTFLPPTGSTNRNIADTEYMGQVFCTGKTPLATPVGKLSSGFIQSAHYVATSDYVQVTGQIDPAKMNLNLTDDGGQYDIAMPKNATCAGWKHFVNLVEPVSHTYCVRCCNSKSFCNRGISSTGCAHIIPGDYSGPYDVSEASGASSSPPNAKQTASSVAETDSNNAAGSTTVSAITMIVLSAVAMFFTH